MANCRGTRSLSLHPGTHTHIYTDAYVLTVAVVVISFLLYECVCLLGVWAGERRSLWLCFGCCVDIWWNKSDICVKVDDFVLQYLCCISAVFCVVFSNERWECQILCSCSQYTRSFASHVGSCLSKLTRRLCIEWKNVDNCAETKPRRLSHISVSVWRAFCSAAQLAVWN